MKLQRGFVMFMGAAWLALAALGGTVATVNHVEKEKIAKDTTSSKPTPVAQADTAPAFIGTGYTEGPYDGTQYRNGGYFGRKTAMMPWKMGAFEP
jgi:hypothetical protein